MYGCSACTYVCIVCVCLQNPEDRSWVSLELTLYTVVSRHAGTGKGTQVLHESSQRSEPLRHLSSPLFGLHMCACLHMWAHVSMGYVCMSASVCVHVYVFVSGAYQCLWVCVWICMSMCVYVYVHACVYVGVYMCGCLCVCAFVCECVVCLCMCGVRLCVSL